MALRDILVSFGVDIQGKGQFDQIGDEADRAKAKAEAAAKAVQAFAGALVGAAIVKGVTSFITSTVEAGAKVADMANKLGVGADELQAFQYASQLTGGSAESAGKGLAYLERQLGNAEAGTKASTKAFAGLGVNIRDANGKLKPMTDLLPDLADAFAKLKDEPSRVAYSMKLFGRAAGLDMLPVLRQGAQGLRDIFAEFTALGGGMQGDFLKAAKEADQGMTRLGWAFTMMKSRVVLGMLPALETAMGALVKLFGYLGHLSDITYLSQTALIALGATALALFYPLLVAIAPVVATATALYLIFDDIFTLFEGGDSVVGRFIDELFGDGAHETFVKTIKEDVTALVNKIREYTPSVQEFFGILREAWNSEPIQVFIHQLGDILGLMGRISRVFGDLAVGNFTKALKDIDRIGEPTEKTEEQKREDDNAAYFKDFKARVDAQNNPQLANVAFRPSSQLPFNAVTGETDDYSIGVPAAPKVEVHNTIHVHGAHTNEGTAAAVAKGAENGTGHALRKAQAAVDARGGTQ